MKNFDHVIKIDTSTKELAILRRDDAGVETLYTKVALPNSSGWDEVFEAFAKQLGENILLDSPAARQLLKL